MFHVPKITATVLAVALLASCKHDAKANSEGHVEAKLETSKAQGATKQQTVTSTPSREKDLLFIIMGGFGSCRFDSSQIMTIGPNSMELAKAFRTSFSDLDKRGFKYQTVLSCFSAFTSDKVYYILPWDPTRIRHESLDTFNADVAYLINSQSTRSVYFIGHSHGGWLTMSTALKNPQNHKFAGIFTIDPISRIKCNSMTYLETLFNFNGVPIFYETIPDCVVAPTDFGANAMKDLRQSTNHWINFYQTGFSYLHSSAITNASENIEFTYPSHLNPHRSMAHDPRVWTKIFDVVRRDFL